MTVINPQADAALEQGARGGSSSPQQWLYPTNVDQGRFHPSPDPALGTRAVVVAATEEDSWAEWPLASGYRTMRPGDVVWIYGDGALCAAATVDHIFKDADERYRARWTWRRDITLALQQPEFELSRHPSSPFRFAGVVRGIRRVDEVTATVIALWVDAAGPDPLGPDLKSDPELGDDDERLWRLAMGAVREGAPEFRRKLMVAYGAQCAITGCSIATALEAAHVRRYRGPRHNIVANGLLLRRDLHALFDAHLIGITPDGLVWANPSVRLDPSYAELHGSEVRLPVRTKDTPRRSWLDEHLAAARAGR